MSLQERSLNQDIVKPPQAMVNRIGGGDFNEIGKHFFDLFKTNGMQPEHSILDIGSGCGRMAVPLTLYLNEKGKYSGFDIQEELVQWCVDNISRRYQNFKFNYVSLFNTRYSPRSQERADRFQFPYLDSEFDFVMATSVFTHLLLDDAIAYLENIYRVMRPNGTAFLTFFLINEEYSLLPLPAKHDYSILFQTKLGRKPLYVANVSVPEAAVAFDESFILRTCRQIGFFVQRVDFGHWRKSGGSTYQDILVLRKF